MVLFCIIVLRLHPAVSLLFAAFVTGILTSSEVLYEAAIQQGLSAPEAMDLASQPIGERVTTAFGNTTGKIGVLILFASIIGMSLMKSGGAERIVRSLFRLFGQKNTSFAFLTGSFTLAIPVFFDTVFYLMIPLVKSISVRNPKKFSLYLMTIIAGGVMAHSLIPPTPGPLFVAKEMGIDLGAMMIGGLAIGSITALSGYLYALWANKKWDLPMRDTPDISIDELKQFSEREERDLPALWISSLSIILPILLITGNTIMNMVFNQEMAGDSWEGALLPLFSVLGNSTTALAIASVIALYVLWSRLKDQKLFQKYLYESLMSAGMIILITAAGGAFGQMLQQTGIGVSVQKLASGYQVAILPLAFVLTAIVRTAQGSATVAMVTTIGIMSGFTTGNALAFHPVYLALAIGCGSKIFPWMNDSAFWIITKMSGMEEQETIRYFSFLLTVMGISGLVAIIILSTIFPFVP